MPIEDDKATGGDARSTLDEVAEVLARQARSALSDVMGAINAYANENKGAAVRQMSDYAEAAEQAAATLKARDNELGSRLLGEAAGQMSRASDTVARATADDVADGLQSAARANPVVFAAGTVLAGVALGYLLKAAASEREDDRVRGHPARRRIDNHGSSSESTS